MPGKLDGSGFLVVSTLGKNKSCQCLGFVWEITQSIWMKSRHGKMNERLIFHWFVLILMGNYQMFLKWDTNVVLFLLKDPQTSSSLGTRQATSTQRGRRRATGSGKGGPPIWESLFLDHFI